MHTGNSEHKLIPLDAYEEGAVIDGLNRMRTERIERGESAEFISDVMLKILRSPTKKARVRDASR